MAFGYRRDEVPAVVHDVLRSPGRPVDAKAREFMELQFGHDFSEVRVHTDSKAAESARAVNALAYTVGSDIVFGSGGYAPETTAGKRLLAHELAHVLQQRPKPQRMALRLDEGQTDPLEREAERAVERVMSAKPATGRGARFSADPSRTWKASRTTTPSTAGMAPPLTLQRAEADNDVPSNSSCKPSAGIPNTDCSAYAANAWWLPSAYVNNATCACETTPNASTANCVRKFLQDRLAATPAWLKSLAALNKPLDQPGWPTYPAYQTFVQSMLTPRIYQDHADAYRTCCCSSGPAPYPAWMGVTSIPIQPCSLVGLTIRYFGSCHGTPGTW